MVYNNPYGKYQSNKVMTASQEELVLMLYEGALKFCNQAIAAVENKNIEEANRLIIRVEKIVNEFRTTLNHNYEVSKNLELLYDYIYRRLVEANLTKDAAILAEVRDMLRNFRDTWKEAMHTAKVKNN